MGWLLSTWKLSSSSEDESGCTRDLRCCTLFSVAFLVRLFHGAAGVSFGNGVVLALCSGVEIAIGPSAATPRGH